MPNGPSERRTASVVAAVLAAAIWINIGALNLEGLAGVVGFRPAPREMASSATGGRSLANQDTARHPRIAAALVSAGLNKGDSIAFVGYSYSAFWARLARLRIVAEIRPDDVSRFWGTGAERRRAVLESMRAAGARAVVAETPSSDANMDGWTELPEGYVMAWLE
jgi:hypothetical protein